MEIPTQVKIHEKDFGSQTCSSCVCVYMSVCVCVCEREREPFIFLGADILHSESSVKFLL
jgi:hypothetical protein